MTIPNNIGMVKAVRLSTNAQGRMEKQKPLSTDSHFVSAVLLHQKCEGNGGQNQKENAGGTCRTRCQSKNLHERNHRIDLERIVVVIEATEKQRILDAVLVSPIWAMHQAL